MESEPSSKTAEQAVVAQLQELVAEAKRGNPKILPKIRQFLREHPQLGQHFGNLAGQVEAKWIGLLAGKNAVIRESLTRRVNELRLKLGDRDASPLEKLLVERVVTSWLMTRYFDSAVLLATENIPPTQARFLQQQLDRAQKRHIEAVRALAEVRKLLP